MASQGTNYNGNKSIGWPIQAVLWLEWATSPPQTRLSLGEVVTFLILSFWHTQPEGFSKLHNTVILRGCDFFKF